MYIRIDLSVGNVSRSRARMACKDVDAKSCIFYFFLFHSFNDNGIPVIDADLIAREGKQMSPDIKVSLLSPFLRR